MPSQHADQVDLVPIEVLGGSVQYFRLDETGDGGPTFQYYTFATPPYGTYPISWDTNWDLVGVRPVGADRYDIQLVHIEEEDLEHPEFRATRDAPGFISLVPAQTYALIRFLEEVGNCQEHASSDWQVELSKVDDPRQLGFRAAPWDPTSEATSYYVPTDNAPLNWPNLVRLIVLVHQPMRPGRGELTGLHFVSFDVELEQRVDMDPWDVDGLGLMPLSRREVCALAQLLREHEQN